MPSREAVPPWPEGLHVIHSPWVRSFLLVETTPEGRRGVAIDTGIFGHTARMDRLLRSLGMEWTDLSAILLTHGHLDHTAHLAEWKRRSGAPVFAHPADTLRLQGRATDHGWSRVGGALEAIGRILIRYQSAAIDHELADGERLPFWGGLEVLHLPGHTAGHCGFLSRRHNVLFSGDLAACEFGHAFPSPAIFTEAPSLLRASLRRAQSLNPSLVLTSHLSGATDEEFTRRFPML